MSYQVLARKWRPQNFKEMVGQQHVLRALINALEDDRLHHAYLFTGTRGVGKTTIARILAKCLNCETGVTSEPCGKCSSCKEIATGSFVDLIEVDAASRTKVEDTRELLDNVQYAPTRGRFKVYLIDEVHMLTGHSFNALLKTLEEPPPHVKFLFATTDPQKLPVTILSRCLQFNLKRMPVDMIAGHLQYLTGQESITSDGPSLKLIARAADGSMRDALSLLDQSIAFCGGESGELKEADVREMLGTISHEPLVALLKAVSAGEGADIIRQIDDMAGVTPDFEAATDALIALLHQVAVQQVVPDAVQDDDSIPGLADLLSKEDVQLYYQIALHGRRDLPLSPDPRSGFEMILLRMLAFRPLQAGMAVQDGSNTRDNNHASENNTIKDSNNIGDKNDQNVVAPESKKKTLASEVQQVQEEKPSGVSAAIAGNRVAEPSTSTSFTATSTETKQAGYDDVPWETLPDELRMDAVPEKARLKTADSDTADLAVKNLNKAAPHSIPDSIQTEVKPGEAKPDKSKVDRNAAWHEIVPELGLSGRAAELIKHCLLESKENGIITLRLDKSSEGLLADTIEQEIQSALSEFYAEPLNLKLAVADIQMVSVESKSNETPAQRTARSAAESQKSAEQNIATDPFVIELQNRFGAQIVPGSVQPK